MLSHDPNHAEARHLLGLALVQTGRPEEGVGFLRRSVELAPDEPTYRRNLGLVLLELGRAEAAADVLERLVARWPGDAAGYSFLGTAHGRCGAGAAALAAHERSLQLAPGDDRVWSDYGSTLLAAGRVDDAIRAQRHALTLNPRNALASLNLGNALRDAGDRAGAVAAYRAAIDLAPGLAIAWHNLGIALRESGDARASVAVFAEAMRRAPGEAAHAAAFAAGCAEIEEPLPAALMPAALACLRHDAIDAQGLAVPLFGALRGEAYLALARTDARDTEGFAAPGDERLLRLLERVLIPDPAAEALFTRLRSALLQRHAAGDARAIPLRLACAVARQAFLNEYIWPVTDSEDEHVNALAEALKRVGPLRGDDEFGLAVLAAYRPIVDLPLPAPDARASPALDALWRAQVADVNDERRLRSDVSVLTPIRAGVSAAVRQQYEENPYPRWQGAPTLPGALPLAQKLRSLFPWLDAAANVPDNPRILVAGCGTGRHPIAAAQLHPTASILAVDISLASLAYAIRQARALGIENVRFAQADLLELATLPERFDVIECAGVLHHLADPLEGWRVLVGLLVPGGLMRVALYSENARRAVVAARRLIAAMGLPEGAAGIRRARQAILALPPNAPARAVASSLDFWSMSGCRDLLFHVQEHRFTLPQIETACDALGLEFLGFEFADPAPLARYRAAHPDDPQARSLARWAAFEAEHPDTFVSMYQFWVRGAQAGESASAAHRRA